MMSDVKVIQVIRTNLLRRGTGKASDPIRIITQYWLMDGTLLFEVDPVGSTQGDKSLPTAEVHNATGK
jgi:hypothetical protein